MINNMLGKIDGIGIYYIVSMLIFIAFFAGVILLLVNMKKSRAGYLKNIPFTDENVNSQN